MFGIGLIVTVLGAYLVGSIPTGYLVARARGVDIQKVGSGNIGATNVFRVLGRKAGVMVLLFDAFKGYAGCAWVSAATIRLLGVEGVAAESLRLAAGLSVVLGHNYTVWLGFRGGKGIASSAGVLLALLPLGLLWSFLAFALVFGLSRYVSLGSMAAALVLPPATWWHGYGPRLVGLATAMSLLALYKHRANVQRLLAGTEPKIGGKGADRSP